MELLFYSSQDTNKSGAKDQRVGCAAFHIGFDSVPPKLDSEFVLCSRYLETRPDLNDDQHRLIEQFPGEEQLDLYDIQVSKVCKC